MVFPSLLLFLLEINDLLYDANLPLTQCLFTDDHNLSPQYLNRTRVRRLFQKALGSNFNVVIKTQIPLLLEKNSSSLYFVK